MRRFPSEQLPTKEHSVLLSRETSHHVLRVVGIAPKEEVELFDGQGRGCVSKLLGVVDGRAEMLWVSTLDGEQIQASLTLVLALTKGDAFATALRMCTEIGVANIVPLQAQRSVPKGDKSVRWTKIVTGAAGQSKRFTIPTVEPLQTWHTIWEVLPDQPSWVLHPVSDGVPMVMPISAPTTIWIGPEGGFTEQELMWLLERGAEHRSLGSLVLKADTAAVVATALSLSHRESI